MTQSNSLTLEEGCSKYLENCRQRNLRDGTINHYRQSYLYFYKFFDPKIPIEDIDEQSYKDYVLHLKATLDNDQTLYGDEDGNVYLLSSSRSADVPVYTNVDTGESVSGDKVTLTKIYRGESDTTNLCHNKGIYDNHMEPYEEMMTSMKKVSDNLVSLIHHFEK